MVKYTVIIPHYDIPELLIRCLKSIPVSKDIQVIVVDDNSPNSESYIEKYPELSRPYLEFIRTTEGRGAGYARNVGLDHAKGKWLLFADADDFFVENAFDMIRSYENCDADVIYFKKKSVSSDDVTQLSNRDEKLNVLIDNYLEKSDELNLRVKYWVPWGKMISRNFVSEKRIRFDEVKYSNDLFFSVYVGINANVIRADKRELYVVTSRNGSLASGNFNKPHELEIRSDVCFRVQKMLYERNIIIKPMPLKYMFLRMLMFNRNLFRMYFGKVDEIYPSRSYAMKDLTGGYMVLIKFGIYCCVLFVLAIGIVKERFDLDNDKI